MVVQNFHEPAVVPGGTVAAEFNGGLVFSVKIAAAGDEQTIFHCDIHIVSRGFLIVIRGECFYSVNLPKKDAVQQF